MEGFADLTIDSSKLRFEESIVKLAPHLLGICSM